MDGMSLQFTHIYYTVIILITPDLKHVQRVEGEEDKCVVVKTDRNRIRFSRPTYRTIYNIHILYSDCKLIREGLGSINFRIGYRPPLCLYRCHRMYMAKGTIEIGKKNIETFKENLHSKRYIVPVSFIFPCHLIVVVESCMSSITALPFILVLYIPNTDSATVGSVKR